MYTDKPYVECQMPECAQPLKALALVATLKKSPQASNTEELARLVLDELKGFGVAEVEVVRLVDHTIHPGLAEDMGDGDEFPVIADKIQAADIVIYATPIQWGVEASPMRRLLERQDSLEEVYRQTGWSPLFNKVAGVVITGSEDGAQHTNGNILNVLQFQGFTIPPEACAYWVGTVGEDPAGDAQRRRSNKATQHMAKKLARNLAFFARLLKTHPLQPKQKPAMQKAA